MQKFEKISHFDINKFVFLKWEIFSNFVAISQYLNFTYANFFLNEVHSMEFFGGVLFQNLITNTLIIKDWQLTERRGENVQ